MKKTAAFLTIIFILVIFPLISSGAFADFIGKGSLPMDMMSEPLSILLFGVGLMVVGGSLRKI